MKKEGGRDAVSSSAKEQALCNPRELRSLSSFLARERKEPLSRPARRAFLLFFAQVRLLPLMSLLLLTLISCTPDKAPQKTTTPPTPAETTPPSQADSSLPPTPSPLPSPSDPDTLAITFCQKSTGPVPIWPLLSELRPLLHPEDLAAADLLERESKAEIPPRELARQRAAARFISENTLCTVEAKRQDGDLYAFAMKQTIPELVDVREYLRLPDSLSLEEVEQRWLDGFRRASTGKTMDHSFGMRLIKVEGRWHVDAQLEARFAAPLRAARALDAADAAMAARDWAKAEAALEHGCGGKHYKKECYERKQRLAQSREAGRAARAQRASLTLREHRLVGRVNGQGHIAPILRVVLDYSDPTPLAEVWIEVDTGEVKESCLLRAKDTPESAPLALQGGESGAEGFCQLKISPMDFSVSVVDAVRAE